MNQMPRKIILVTGASGLVGKALCQMLIREHFEVIVLGRDEKKSNSLTFPCRYFSWPQPESTLPPIDALDVHGVIHLMGEPIAEKKWTPKIKNKLHSSRVLSTRNLVDALKTHAPRLEAFMSASAVGIYGPQDHRPLSETATLGEDFLAQLCRDWEDKSRLSPVRNVQLRTGLVLSSQGGALAKMLPAFEVGLGGKISSGQQMMSWIHIHDLVEAIIFCLNNKNIHGPVNAVAPHAVANHQFTRELAKSLKVSARFTVPSWALKLVMGESSQLLLTGQNVVPDVLQKNNFHFQFPTLDLALDDIFSWKETAHDRQLLREQWIERDGKEVFDFFSNEKNLEKLTPDFMHFKIVNKSSKTVGAQTLIDYKLKVHGIPFKWRTLIAMWNPNECFQDVQLKGPYKKWVHTHSFEPMGMGTLMTDKVVYQLPIPQLTTCWANLFIKKELYKIFNFRQKKMTEIFR